MKTVATAMLVLTLVITVGYGQQESSYKTKGWPSEPASVSIHTAALQGNVEAIRQHIKAGTDLNEKDAWGSTPLIIAATFGKTEVAKALIGAGADMNATNNDGATALHAAAFLCRI